MLEEGRTALARFGAESFGAPLKSGSAKPWGSEQRTMHLLHCRGRVRVIGEAEEEEEEEGEEEEKKKAEEEEEEEDRAAAKPGPLRTSFVPVWRGAGGT